MEAVLDVPVRECTEGEVTWVRVDEVICGAARRVKNPRTTVDAGADTELESSIRAQGLNTPILIRPLDTGFEVVAGERRLRAYRKVFGDQARIPALVKTMNDAAAAVAASSENIDRLAMSALDEAEGVAAVLADCNADRDEASRRLGWSRTKLDKRLGLMYATDKVRNALRQNKIGVGHAELLAACRKESQDQAIEQLQKAPMSVQELKRYLEQVALVLEKGIFDKTDCAGCHHNSSNQGALFAEAISNGRCTNKACFDAKTDAQLAILADSLKDEFQVVRIVRPGENLTLVPLKALGAKGVGLEQAKACGTCKDYGAVVSAVPDKMGQVFKGMCMNVPCNQKLVAERIKAEKEAVAQQTKGVVQAAQKTAAQAGMSSVPVASATTGSVAASSSTKDTKAVPKVVSGEPRSAVKDYREKLWRSIYQRAVVKLGTAGNRAVLLAICLTRPSVLSKGDLQKAAVSVMGEVSALAGPASILGDVTSLDNAQLAMALNAIAANVESTLAISDVTGILKFFDVKVEDYWKIDKDFFELLTMVEIDAVCDEIGLKAALGTGYAKLRNSGKREFIAGLMGVANFDFKGRVPKMINL